MSLDKLKREYDSLKSQLVNLGQEESMCEVMWNDLVKDDIDNLFKDFPNNIKKLIILNHI